jgi:hypothetical protein
MFRSYKIIFKWKLNATLLKTSSSLRRIHFDGLQCRLVHSKSGVSAEISLSASGSKSKPSKKPAETG